MELKLYMITKIIIWCNIKPKSEEIFSKFPIEVKNIISKYIDKELDKRASLYYTEKIVLKVKGKR